MCSVLQFQFLNEITYVGLGHLQKLVDHYKTKTERISFSLLGQKLRSVPDFIMYIIQKGVYSFNSIHYGCICVEIDYDFSMWLKKAFLGLLSTNEFL